MQIEEDTEGEIEGTDSKYQVTSTGSEEEEGGLGAVCCGEEEQTSVEC